MKKLSIILLLTAMLLTATACQNGTAAVNTDNKELSIANDVSVHNTVAEVQEIEKKSNDMDKESSASSTIESSVKESSAAAESSQNTEKNNAESSAEVEISITESVIESEVSIKSEVSTQTENAEISTQAERAEISTHISSNETEQPTSLPAEESSTIISQAEISQENNSKSDNFLTFRTKVNAISVTWNSQQNADGYIIQCSRKKDFTESSTFTKRTTALSANFENLTQNRTYYLRAATYRTENGKQVVSGWSEPVKAKLKEIVEIDGITYVDGILIANKTYSLPQSYGSGLTDETSAAYYNMVAGAAADGITLWMVSGFRSYETQYYTYNSFVQDRGVELADLCSARPGHSEHQSGMAIDFNTTSDYFAGTPEANWIEAHCAEYGFILRYPRGKESITGYKYEPWHVRYVGLEKAVEITNSGLTVEEYYGITSVYTE